MNVAPPLFLIGPRVGLRPLCEADVAGPYVGWLNDPDVCRGNSHCVYPYTPEAALEYVRHARSTRDDLILAVVLREDGRHVGNVALQGVHRVYRSAEFSILLGDPACRGRGYGAEAGRLLLHHGFTALNLHRVGCGTFADNAGMIRLAAKLGMREEGCRRQAAFKAGRFVDVIEFGVLADEFAALGGTE